jgi:glutamine amidotransferase-like uncharacterized protein
MFAKPTVSDAACENAHMPHDSSGQRDIARTSWSAVLCCIAAVTACGSGSEDAAGDWAGGVEQGGAAAESGTSGQAASAGHAGAGGAKSDAGAASSAGGKHDGGGTTGLDSGRGQDSAAGADAGCGDGKKSCGGACVAIESPTDHGCSASQCSPCQLAHAQSKCASGKCAVAQCSQGYADCDANAANGCETDSSSDANHCGQCGKSCNGGVCDNGTCATRVVKVVIFSGPNVGQHCLPGTEAMLDQGNASHLVAGVRFERKRANVINAASLAGQDVVVIPGGGPGATYLGDHSHLDGAAIKSFVSAGGGYLGTCAGAYTGVSHVDGYYDGWGVAPHVKAKAVTYEGLLHVTFTSPGADILGVSGEIQLLHAGGAAMYGGGTVLATFSGTGTGYKGYAAIVTDTYGSGRSILCGPHPELEPTHPEIVSRMVGWAAKAIP